MLLACLEDIVRAEEAFACQREANRADDCVCCETEHEDHLTWDYCVNKGFLPLWSEARGKNTETLGGQGIGIVLGGMY